MPHVLTTGSGVLFDETQGKERLVLIDKAGATITLDSTSGAEKVTIQDRSGAKVCLDTAAQNIAIEHPKGSTIIWRSDGTVSITAKGNLELTSLEGDINLMAANVNVRVIGAMDVS
jgi:hypothetical protein